MTTAEQSARADGAAAGPKGCVRAVGPDGETPIWVKAPRAPGPWWRVKHVQYGHRLVQAATEDEAVAAFFREFAPNLANNADWCRENMRLNGRVAPLPGTAPALADKAPAPAPARKGEK